ncbi:hypothetical protein JTB14_006505 [Gonioctena quinquepunctata]|nr:hypothetical protein JTB14_006505 [Gonioctena quinquepunctata]
MEKKNLKKVKRNVFDSKGGESSDSSGSSLSEPNYISTDNEDSSEEENQDAHCVYCSQQYSTDTSGEPWIRCIRCLEWAHQKCWGEKDWKKFVCDNCL